MELGADGVHLGEHDGGIASARTLLGGDAIIGVSCYDDIERARTLVAQGADYIAFGAFFPSPTKPHARRAGIDLALRERKSVIAVAGLVGGGALPQANKIAAAHIDGRIFCEFHVSFHCRKFERRRAPTAADRSGWNWAPATLLRCTIAAKRSPCVQAAMQSSVTGAA